MIDLPAHQMTEATYAEFSAWWPLFERYIPQYTDKCTPLSQWDTVQEWWTRWNTRLHTMKYECAAVMNGLGLVPGHSLNGGLKKLDEGSGDSESGSCLLNSTDELSVAQVSDALKSFDPAINYTENR